MIKLISFDFDGTLADSVDFSEEKIAEAGITKRFYNDELTHCMKEILSYIKVELQ